MERTEHPAGPQQKRPTGLPQPPAEGHAAPPLRPDEAAASGHRTPMRFRPRAGRLPLRRLMGVWLLSILLAGAAAPAASGSAAARTAAAPHRSAPERRMPAAVPADTLRTAEDPARTIDIREVEVRGRRTLSEVGATQTRLDTFALRENIVNSLAEVLAQKTPVFIKAYGRGTMATASLRGTSPSHTQVTWNGLKLNSPMLGMVDFSLIPSYLIDDAELLHGASSVRETGGGLGGAVVLGTRPAAAEGWGLDFIQGISSFSTYDEFLKLSYGRGPLRLTTRLCYVSSDNDFPYTNYDKRPNPDGSYVEDRNKNCDYRDLHLMQEFYYRLDERQRLSAAVWFMNSERGVPMLTVNYRDEDQSENRQDERSLRAVASWERLGRRMKLRADGGYAFSRMLYRYSGDVGGTLQEAIRSLSRVHTGYARAAADLYALPNLLVKAGISAHLHAVESRERYTREGYDRRRVELSADAGVRYELGRLGLGGELRMETYGRRHSPLIYALYADWLLVPKYGLTLRASLARNYRYPTLNDLYFQPGGNPALRPESGHTCEAGATFRLAAGGFSFDFDGSVYDSQIDDWILWLPTFKGVWTPTNVKRVHSYGVELRGQTAWRLSEAWSLRMEGHWAWTRSTNHGEPQGPDDESVGKQLVYVPEYSSAVTGELTWRTWSLRYKYNYYSRRYTSSSNEPTRLSELGSYYMNDLSLEKRFALRWADLSVKACVYNLFNEEYVSVLSRPMARRNYGFFLGITPRFGHRKAPK